VSRPRHRVPAVIGLLGMSCAFLSLSAADADSELALRQAELARLAEKAARFAESRRPLPIDDEDVIPRRSMRYLDDRLVIDPLAMISLGYDSNPRRAENNPEGDPFVVGLIGIAGEYHLSTADRLQGQATLLVRRYQSVDERDLTGGEGFFGWRHVGQALTGGVSVRGELGDEPQTSIDDAVERSVVGGEANLGWRGATDRISTGLSIEQVDWREAGSNYDAQERDHLGGAVRVRAERRLGIGVMISGTVLVGANTYREGSRFNDSTLSALHVGGAVPTGLRSGVYGEAGVRMARYTDPFAGDPTYDDQVVVRPSGLLGWSWRPDIATGVLIESRSWLEDGTTANAVWTWTTRVQGKLRLRVDSFWFTELVHTTYTDSGAATGNPTGKRTVDEIRTWIDWTFTRGLKAEARVVYAQTDSVLGNDYSRLRTMLSLTAAW